MILRQYPLLINKTSINVGGMAGNDMNQKIDPVMLKTEGMIYFDCLSPNTGYTTFRT